MEEVVTIVLFLESAAPALAKRQIFHAFGLELARPLLGQGWSTIDFVGSFSFSRSRRGHKTIINVVLITSIIIPDRKRTQYR